jgi:predicted transcriptional regulator
MSVAPINPSTPRPDLETRIENRKRELISEIVENKKNSSRAGAAEAIDRAKARLSELAHIVKEGVIDGWANVGPTAKRKLDEWMAR